MAFTHARHSEATPLLSDLHFKHVDRDEEANQADSRNVDATPLPRAQLLCILLIFMYEPIQIKFENPFINELVLEYGISMGDQKSVAYYMGLVNSSFFLAQCASVFLWCRLSDSVGRRPVIIFRLCASAIATVGFGLSKTFPALLIFRAMTGGMNGNLGILKGMIAEITDESNQAKAFSFTPAVFAFSSIIGPTIGGSLSNPVKRFPSVFGSSTILKTYPYLLPCLATASYAVIGVLIAVFFLKETSGIKQAPSSQLRTAVAEVPSDQMTNPDNSKSTSARNSATPSIIGLLTPRVRAALLNSSLFTFFVYMFGFTLLAFIATPPLYGGMGLSPTEIGLVLSIAGTYEGIFQLGLFPTAIRRLGTTMLFRMIIAGNVVLVACFPLMFHFLKQSGRLSSTIVLLFIIQLSILPFLKMGNGCLSIFLTSAAPTRNSLGGTVGLGQTLDGIMRAIGPSLAGALFAVSIEKNLLGGNFVCLVLICIVIVSFVASFTLPRVVRRASDE
ncbi:MFS general substrate transporter [Sistotremastrum niveocremeum HHB9708]|uniref:MFS general substrate transporter n=1 Tax=Sistotremastrum niveocremeum HHB9708 TaxID=1314777 RepID=A0A164Q276_9AGAM|nr:MFS general substrate transporter [Sistotremastrum niveocremeum HHB9708]